jgi:CRISPR/Cas system CSM-associated protein Csm2 small subunit
MSIRVQVVLDKHEKQAFRAAARRAGKSLSAWMKECALKRLEASSAGQVPQTADELRRFFEECDQREKGEEPDWAEQRRVIEGAATSGSTET